MTSAVGPTGFGSVNEPLPKMTGAISLQMVGCPPDDVLNVGYLTRTPTPEASGPMSTTSSTSTSPTPYLAKKESDTPTPGVKTRRARKSEETVKKVAEFLSTSRSGSTTPTSNVSMGVDNLLDRVGGSADFDTLFGPTTPTRNPLLDLVDFADINLDAEAAAAKAAKSLQQAYDLSK